MFASLYFEMTLTHIAVHSEAIWGVMIALVFFAIFEPDDENKS